jgi:hypothetical protein
MTDASKKKAMLQELLNKTPSHVVSCLQEISKDFDGVYGADLDLESRFAIAERAFAVFDSITGGSSPIVSAPKHLLDLVNATNRIISFVLDDTTHFGTGILVGSRYVLTASHLFFERKTRKLIDPSRLKRITAEVQTTMIGTALRQGATNTSPLYEPHTDNWLVDPPIKDGVAQRDLFNFDFAIVRLQKAFGDDDVGSVKRSCFDIPTADAAEVLATGLVFRIFQFLDRGPLLTSSGFVHQVNPNGMRILHTASTAGSASGAPLISDAGNLLGLHVSGCASNERPKFNRAIPIRRVAEIIDKPDDNGKTIRDRLKA